MHDITQEVAAIVSESGIKMGTVNVFNIGSTGAIGTIEFEPGLQRDLPEILNELMPPSRDYGHEQTWGDVPKDLTTIAVLATWGEAELPGPFAILGPWLKRRAASPAGVARGQELLQRYGGTPL